MWAISKLDFVYNNQIANSTKQLIHTDDRGYIHVILNTYIVVIRIY